MFLDVLLQKLEISVVVLLAPAGETLFQKASNELSLFAAGQDTLDYA